MSSIQYVWYNMFNENDVISVYASNREDAINKILNIDFDKYHQVESKLIELRSYFKEMKKKYDIKYFYPDSIILRNEKEINLNTHDYSIITMEDIYELTEKNKFLNALLCENIGVHMIINKPKNDCIEWIVNHECTEYHY